MQLKMCDSHLTCKVSSKCLNVCELVGVVEWNKRWFPYFPCCPVSRQCPSKKTLLEKKTWLPLLSFKITFKDTSFHISINSLYGFISLSKMLVEFSLKRLYSSMSAKTFQIYGVHIPRKCSDSLDALMIDAL